MLEPHTNTELPAPRQQPIGEVIRHQLARLEISKPELVERWGYCNVAKGLRRLDEIAQGRLVPESNHLTKLAGALELPLHTLVMAIGALQEKKRIAERATDPGAFYPDGYLIGAEKHPTSITIYGITGGAERWLKIHGCDEAASHLRPAGIGIYGTNAARFAEDNRKKIRRVRTPLSLTLRPEKSKSLGPVMEGPAEALCTQYSLCTISRCRFTKSKACG